MGASLQAQLITVNGTFSRDTILLGEHLTFVFTIEADSALETDVPLMIDTLSNSIEILDTPVSDTLLSGDRRIITQQYRVTSFRKGSNMVPPIPVAFRSDALTDTIYSYPQFLYVNAPVIDTTQAIKPIKGPINTPVNFAEMLPWLLAATGAIALTLLIIWLLRYYKRRRANGNGLFAVPTEPAHVIAIRELDRLTEEKLHEQGEGRSFYTRLTEIVRRYMENAYQIPALERITIEILEEFAPVANDRSELIDLLRDLLELADLVKFAREEPSRTEMEKHLANGYAFVKMTHEMQVATEAALNAAEEESAPEHQENVKQNVDNNG
jgi:hypothetical protein